MDQTESHRWRIEQNKSNNYVPLPMRQREYFNQLRSTKKKLKKIDEKEVTDNDAFTKEMKNE